MKRKVFVFSKKLLKGEKLNTIYVKIMPFVLQKVSYFATA